MSSSPLAPLVSVSGYTGKVLRIGCAHDPFKKSKKILSSMTTDGNDENEEEEEEDIFLNAAEADRKTVVEGAPREGEEGEKTDKNGGGDGTLNKGDEAANNAAAAKKNDNDDDDEDEDEDEDEEQE